MSSGLEFGFLFKKYLDNTCTEDEEIELCEILMVDVDEVYDKKLLPLFKKYIDKLLSDCNTYEEFVATGHDLYCVTIDHELFEYTLTFSNKIDIVKCMVEYADGPEHMISIIELMYEHKLHLPREQVESNFTDNVLDWCGWGNRAEELREMFIKDD